MNRASSAVAGKKTFASAIRNFPMLAWGLFVLMIPLYIAPSGLPQPGDALIVVLFPAALFASDRRLDRPTRAILRPLVWFTIWVAVVNYGWALVLWKWDRLKDFIIHPFFYLFNLVLFFSGLMIARRNREAFLRLSTYIVYASIFLQFLASLFYGTGLRDTGFFNSPNQLGYFVLLSACTFALMQRPLRIPRWVTGSGITCCAYLALLTGSRSALAGIAILLFIMLFANPRTIILASLAAIAVTLFGLGGPLSTAIDNSERRAQSLSRHGTFAEERGYDRIWKNPEYLLTGAGEGEYQRFVKPTEKGRELHSSFGSVVFGYGIVGTVLFILFLARVCKGRSMRDLAILGAGLSFALAHQGLRFTMFWVVLVLFVVLKQLDAARSQMTAATTTGTAPAT